jgi:hypothetical protein
VERTVRIFGVSLHRDALLRVKKRRPRDLQALQASVCDLLHIRRKPDDFNGSGKCIARTRDRRGKSCRRPFKSNLRQAQCREMFARCPLSKNSTKQQSSCKAAAKQDPWRLRLERLRGKVGYDAIERISTQSIFDTPVVCCPELERVRPAIVGGSTAGPVQVHQ